jgi:copper homeostasis protein
MVLVEACVNSATSAIEAEKGGAHRVELCDNLYEGGTTPSAATISVTAKHISIDLHVLIRPRGGDFLYSDLEFEVMLQDIQYCKQNGVKGVVLGVLNVTFHRAFDMVANPLRALEDVIATGCHRILTSGLANKAWDGREMIANLVQAANARIIIMAGSGVNIENVEKLVLFTGVTEIHTSARTSYPSRMKHQTRTVFMGGMPEIPEYEITFTDALKVKLVVQSLCRN